MKLTSTLQNLYDNSDKLPELNPYFGRLAELRLTPKQAESYNLYDDVAGIRIVPTDIRGEKYTYIPKRNRQRPTKYRLEKAKSQDQFNPNSDQARHLAKTYSYFRLKPQLVKDGNKYKHPSTQYETGFFVPFQPTPQMCEDYKAGKKVDHLVLTEGYFKAVAAQETGINCGAFMGVSVFQLTNELKEYIKKCGVEKIIILYDADAPNLSKNPLKADTPANQRPINFYHYARKFAAQFFEFVDQEALSTKLHFSVIKGQHKGLDDILLNNDSDTIKKNLLSLETNEHFTTFRLYKTSYESNLQQFYFIDSVRSFYQTHKAILKTNTFSFKHKNGSIGRYRFNKKMNRLITIDNPFFVSVKPNLLFKCSKHLRTKQQEQLFRFFNQNRFIFFDGPTSTGKTFLSFLFAKSDTQNRRFIFVNPTRTLAQQTAKEYNTTLICEGWENADLEAAHYSKIVVTTYNSLHRLDISDNDVLIVDEAHNLINQFGFRAKELRQVLAALKLAGKTIMLSGTPNNLFIKNEDFKLVRIQQTDRKPLPVFPVIYNKDSAIANVIARLEKIDWTEDKKHVVFINSVADLQKIEQHFQSKLSGQIEVICRAFSDDSDTYQSIIDKQKIGDDKKLILCTCLISEGVNINDENVDSVHVAGIRCIDTFIQFISRFRKAEQLKIYSYFKDDTSTSSDKVNVEVRFKNQLELATAHAKLMNNEATQTDATPNIGDKSEVYNLAFWNGSEYEADKLNVYYNEYQRRLQNTNEIQFFSDLDAEYSHIVSVQAFDKEDIDTAEIAQDLKDKDKALKQQQEKQQQNLLNDLEAEPTTVLTACHGWAKDSRNSGLVKKIQEVYFKGAKPSETEDSLIFQSKNSDLKKYGLYQKIIGRFLKMYPLRHHLDIFKVLNELNTDKAFNQFYHSLRINSLVEFWENSPRHKRRKLFAHETADAKAYLKTRTTLQKMFDDNDGELAFQQIKAKLELMHSINDDVGKIFSLNEVEQLIHSLFDVDAKNKKKQGKKFVVISLKVVKSIDTILTTFYKENTSKKDVSIMIFNELRKMKGEVPSLQNT